MTGLESKTTKRITTTRNLSRKTCPLVRIPSIVSSKILAHQQCRWNTCPQKVIALQPGSCYKERCGALTVGSSQALKSMALKLAFLPTNGTLLILAKEKNVSRKSSRRHRKMWLVDVLPTFSGDFAKAFPNFRSSR